MFPTVSQYSKTLHQKGLRAFKTLSDIEIIPSRTNPVIYPYGSGTFAVVFKARELADDIALRCFISGHQDYVERYRKITGYLATVQDEWVTKVVLLEDEICVNGSDLPIIKMDWVKGQLINDFITDSLNDNAELLSLQQNIVYLSQSLEKRYIGHGDIQCGNVILDFSRKIRLIDYDAMFIPDFRGMPSPQGGRPEFQHPHRQDMDYNEKIDRFSFWVILCALEALKFNKRLWQPVKNGGFNTEENILFSGSDFENLEHSPLITALNALEQESVNFYLDNLKRFCRSSPNSIDGPELFARSKIAAPLKNTGLETFVEIISIPSGAYVLDSSFKNIGRTPLSIKRDIYLNKRLIVSYGEQNKEVIIKHEDESKEVVFQPLVNEMQEIGEIGAKIVETSILAFSVSPAIIKSGEYVKLTWEVRNCDDIRIKKDDELFEDGLSCAGDTSVKLLLKPPGKVKCSECVFCLEAQNESGETVKQSEKVLVEKKGVDVGKLIGIVCAFILIVFVVFVYFLPSRDNLKSGNKMSTTESNIDNSEDKGTYSSASNRQNYYTNQAIIDILKEYYQYEKAKNVYLLSTFFAEPVENYFGKKGVMKDSLKSMILHSWAMIDRSFNYPNFDSIEIEWYQGAYTIHYPLVYEYTLKNGRSYFLKLRANLKLNQNGQIFYINNSLIFKKEVERIQQTE